MTKTEQKRYRRQVLVKSVGRKGQSRLLGSKVVLVGCGALGTACANSLIRAGAGSIRLVDRFILTLGDLQECSLYDERAVEDSLPKAVALGHLLSLANSGVSIEHKVEELNSETAGRLFEAADIIIDGGVSNETRLLINDFSIANGIPWVYGGVADSVGMVIPFDGREGGCLRCILPSLPFSDAHSPAPVSRGLLGAAAMTTGAVQAIETLRILATGGDYRAEILWFDLWNHDFRRIDFSRSEDCRCCGRKNFSFLNKPVEDRVITNLSEKRYQVMPIHGQKPHIGKLYTRLHPLSSNITFNDQLLIAALRNCNLFIFKDGRVVIEGVDSSEEALGIFDEYILDSNRVESAQDSYGLEG